MTPLFSGFKNTVLATLMLLATTVQAQTQNVTLHDVTVFIRGAELFNSSKVKLPAGESEVVFTNIASGLIEQSLMLDSDNGVVVQSFSIKRVFLTEHVSPEVEQLTKQIDNEVREQSKLNVQREVIQAQLAVLESNRAQDSEKGASVVHVNQMLELVSRRMSEELLLDIELKEKIAAIDKNLEKLKIELDKARKKTGQTLNQLVVKFYTPNAVTSNVK